jgi:4-amino-4-deoxy-L-arabinose transferase-like glycosyltransferase
VAAIAVAAAALRAAAFSGTELYADEAYYWLWSLRPAAGYYDHPPLVAWLIASTSRLLPGELGVRLTFLVAGGLTVIFTALLAQALAPSSPEGEAAAPAAVWAALLAASAPMLHLTGAMALPDGPLTAAFTAALWLLATAAGPRWIWAGAAVGVALLAKYTAALLAPALVLLVAWDPTLRRDLRTRWPWLGAAVALALFAPNLLWNARHGWVSLRFQLGHGLGAGAGPAALLQYLGGQLAGAGPVPLLAGGAALLRARTPAARRVAAGVLVPLGVITAAALRGRVEANWPALVYPALCAAAAAALTQARPALARAAVGGSVAISAVLLAGFAVEQRHPRLLAGTAAIARFHGSRQVARELEDVARRTCPALGCDPAQPFVFSVNYQYVGELAFYGGFRRFGPVTERRTQLDLWRDRLGLGEPFFFVGYDGPPAELRQAVPPGAERATVRVPITYAGQRLWQLAVTPFGGQPGP